MENPRGRRETYSDATALIQSATNRQHAGQPAAPSKSGEPVGRDADRDLGRPLALLCVR